MSSPDLFPVNFNDRYHLIAFVRMTREMYRDLSFLDPRASRMGPDLFTMNFDDLLLYNRQVKPSPACLHLILHTALCCSTLLARYLDLISPCFVLREPNFFAQIAMRRPRGPFDISSGVKPAANMQEDEWEQIFDLGMQLMARTYAPGETVIIKVNDLCNVLGEVSLKRDSRTKILFLFVGLRTFVLSSLQSEKRRAWVKRRLLDNELTIKEIPQLAEIETKSLTDAQGGAFLWLLNSALCSRMLGGPYGDRVSTLDGELVSESPRETLGTVAEFFDVTLDQAQLEAALVHPSISRYSKNLMKPYSTESRHEHIRDLEDRFGVEADAGVEWATRIKPELEFGTA